MKRPYAMAAFLGLMGCVALGLNAQERPIPDAPGPYLKATLVEFQDARNFKPGEKVVFTYYFYWYDAPSKAHVVDGDGTDALTTHPPTLEGFSYRSKAWHRRQLEDMIEAGIDVVLPVFWGAPSEQGSEAELFWSFEGLPPLVEARDELLKEGKKPPAIGLFYDTSTLQHNEWREHVDLRTARGRAWFYATIRDFFSTIPPRHWALIDGKPPVFLYAAAFAKGHDQGVVEHLNSEFAKDFAGKVPYLVREVSWNLKTDNVYAWGGALGTKLAGIGALGPGYDHSAVPGREPLVAPREGGKFYERNWEKFLRRPSNMVAIETWNEFHEGTDIAESKEYGRQYIRLTRKYVDLFKQGWKPEPVQGPYTNAMSAFVSLGATDQTNGLRHIQHEDGRTAPAFKGGREGRETVKTRFGGNFVYFVAEESFKPQEPTDYVVEVELYDEAPGRIEMQYDGSDPEAPFGGAYTSSPDRFELKGAKTWTVATFRLPKAVFLSSQNSGADFRLQVEAERCTIGRVTVKRARP